MLMLLDEYQKFCGQNHSPSIANNPLYFAVGLAGETGEVCELIKKEARDKFVSPEGLDKKKLTKELGDVLWYLTNIATLYGIALEDVVDENIRKLTARHGGTYKPHMSDSEVEEYVFKQNGPHIEMRTKGGKFIKFLNKEERERYVTKSGNAGSTDGRTEEGCCGGSGIGDCPGNGEVPW